MFNECHIHLLDCTYLNVMCVCLIIYGSIQNIFDHFICFWKWFLSLFVFMFSIYFVFNCLNMLCIEKTGVRFFRGSAGDSPVAKPQLWVHPEAFGGSLATHSWLNLATRPVAKRPKQLFIELFREKLVLNLSHPLLNPSFNIYIKT